MSGTITYKPAAGAPIYKSAVECILLRNLTEPFNPMVIEMDFNHYKVPVRKEDNAESIVDRYYKLMDELKKE